MAGVDPNVLRELEAKRLEFSEVDLPRFQTGFPPQHLLLTLLGDFWTGRHEPLPSAALVALLSEFDVNEAGARAAIGRLAKRGNLDVVREGRYTSYRIADRLVELLPYGSLHTQSFGYASTGWNGQWTMVAFSISDDTRRVRLRLRSALELLGYAPLYDGVWVSPYPPDDRLQATLNSFAELSCTVIVGPVDADDNRVSPASAWDLAPLRALYERFISNFTPVRTQMNVGSMSDRDALVARIQVAYRWFVIATVDPDLPAELLPSDWPRNAARDIFVDLYDELGARAEAQVRAIVRRFSPELSERVTHNRTAQETSR
jgi:phenylacetic acid degradation operon negative regulatory protein